MSDASDRVDWFLLNLDLQIEERRLRSKGVETEVHFDTRDVRDTLLGFEAFLGEDLNFDTSRFNSKLVLVHALAIAGWVGPLHMLMPHKGELLRLMRSDFGTSDLHARYRDLVRQFLLRIGVNDTVWSSKNLSMLDLAQRVVFVRENAGSPEKLFKAVHLTRKTWRLRLLDFVDTGLLVLDGSSADFAEILGDPSFERLRKALRKRRPHLSVNNLTDAAALTSLAQLLDAFKAGRSEKLPLLFSSDRLFFEVLREAQVVERFSYRAASASKGRFSVLRDADYFVFRAIFDPPESRRPALVESGVPIYSDCELEELRARVQACRSQSEQLEEALKKEPPLRGLTLLELINQVRDLSLFGRVWLPLSPTELAETEEKLLTATSQLVSDDFRVAVNTALREAQDEIEQHTRAYRLMSEFWSRLSLAVSDLQKRLAGSRAGRGRDQQREAPELDPFIHFGLLRFCFPPDAHGVVRERVAAFALEGQARRDAMMRLLSLYASATSGETISELRLIELVAPLWCLGMDRDIDVALGSRPRSESLSLDICLLAARFRLNERVGEGRSLLRDLEKKYRSERILPTEAGELQVGLAYLHFHLVRRLEQSAVAMPADIRSELYQTAIAFAKGAWESLGDGALRIYALNCWLYYMIEAKELGLLSQMREAEAELSKRLDAPGLWSYRYDDTLARFYHLCSEHSDSRRGRRKLASQAWIHIERAYTACLGDSEVLSFRGQLSQRS